MGRAQPQGYFTARHRATVRKTTFPRLLARSSRIERLGPADLIFACRNPHPKLFDDSRAKTARGLSYTVTDLRRMGSTKGPPSSFASRRGRRSSRVGELLELGDMQLIVDVCSSEVTRLPPATSVTSYIWNS